MIILQFLFFIFIAVFFVGLFVAVRVYMKIKHAAGKFRDFAGGGFTNGQNTGNSQGNATYRKQGVTIIDNRTNFEKTRKIIPDNVGDFVKYKEVKN